MFHNASTLTRNIHSLRLARHGFGDWAPTESNAIKVVTSTAHDSAKHVALGGVDRHLGAFMVPVDASPWPTLSTAGSQGVSLVGLERKALNDIVGTNSNGVDPFALAQLQRLCVTASVITGLFSRTDILDRQGIDTMAIGIDGNFGNLAVVLVVKSLSSTAAKCLGNDNLLRGLLANFYSSGLGRSTFRIFTLVVTLFLLFFLLRLGRLLLGRLDGSGLSLQWRVQNGVRL